MSSVEIPERLGALMAPEPQLAAATLAFVDRSAEILGDNKLPFFPAYTDHGCRHVQQVLHAATALVPAKVWDKKLLRPADAVVLTCATVLHDLAMHIREHGFMELVADDTRYAPLPWFCQPQSGRPADLPWPALWEAFRKESRHLTKSQLDRLLGGGNAGVPAIAFGDATPPIDTWNEPDRLLIGEFLRRHHARLAHEIAVYGFPGANPERHPALEQTLPHLADAVGAVARSHNERLRSMLAYVAFRHGGNQRPSGAVLPYLMGLLRVADYFQLDASRAPFLLLHLREPQSPQSVQEWHKHQAVKEISWDHDDPEGVYLDVLPSHGLRTHLQLQQLVESLQQELDVTTAVLSETYGTTKLSTLRLAKRRVHTNLSEQGLHEQLPFIPRRAALRSAEDLFRLVIHDLYGDQPTVAGRELMQNAVDAVRERQRWEARRDPLDADAFRTQAADVVVELHESAGQVLLRVADRGIGMTPDTVVDQFLTAGASFGPPHEPDEESDHDAAVRWMKAGRFGIGAFAAFLLGTEIHVKTRHVESERGIAFTASLDQDIVQIDWETDELPFGTEIVVPFRLGAFPSLDQLLLQIRGWYVLRQPSVEFSIVQADGRRTSRPSVGEVPTDWEQLPPAWRRLAPQGLDAVLWTPHRGEMVTLSHNGILIDEPGPSVEALFRRRVPYEWTRRTMPVRTPSLAVFDSRHLLGLSLNRYQLSSRTLPFEVELLDAIGTDVVAHALAAGAQHYPLGSKMGLQPVFTPDSWVPLSASLVDRYVGEQLCVLWAEHSGAPDAMARLFLGDAAECSEGWGDLTARVAITEPEDVGMLGSGPRSLSQLDSEILQLRRALAWWETASILLVPPGLDAHASSNARILLPRWNEDSVSMDGVRYVRFGAGADDGVARLTELAADLVQQRGEAEAVALTLLAPAKRGARLADPIGKPWESILGGMLERDAGGHAARVAEACASRPELEDLLERWKLTLQTPEATEPR